MLVSARPRSDSPSDLNLRPPLNLGPARPDPGRCRSVGAGPPRTPDVPRSQRSRSRAPSSTSPRHASIRFNLPHPRPYQLPDSPNPGAYLQPPSPRTPVPAPSASSCAGAGAGTGTGKPPGVRRSAAIAVQSASPASAQRSRMSTPARGEHHPASTKVRAAAVFAFASNDSLIQSAARATHSGWSAASGGSHPLRARAPPSRERA